MWQVKLRKIFDLYHFDFDAPIMWYISNLYCNEYDRKRDNYVFTYSEKHDHKSLLINEMRRNNDRNWLHEIANRQCSTVAARTRSLQEVNSSRTLWLSINSPSPIKIDEVCWSRTLVRRAKIHSVFYIEIYIASTRYNRMLLNLSDIFRHSLILN